MFVSFSGFASLLLIYKKVCNLVAGYFHSRKYKKHFQSRFFLFFELESSFLKFLILKARKFHFSSISVSEKRFSDNIRKFHFPKCKKSFLKKYKNFFQSRLFLLFELELKSTLGSSILYYSWCTLWSKSKFVSIFMKVLCYNNFLRWLK